MLALYHYVTFLALRNDFSIRAVHLPGKFNIIADHLSHFQASPDFLIKHNLHALPAYVSSPASMTDVITQLLQASIVPATRRKYCATLAEFLSIVPGASIHSSALVNDILYFIAHLQARGVSAVSIRSKLSAISFWHHLNQWANPCNQFLVKKVLLGVANLHLSKSFNRLPVYSSLLLRLLSVLPSLQMSPYEVKMYTAMFTLAFFAFLRVGEYTLSRHCLQLSDIVVSNTAVHIQFSSFKHSVHKTCLILLPAISSPLYPVRAMSCDLQWHPSGPGTLFRSMDSLPLCAREVRRVLYRLSVWLGLPEGSLTPHSFRIGAATMAASLGIPDEIISRMGCWSSKAYLSYIRCSVNCM